jgi:predicted metal-dependent phosphoesterase TrpH
MRWQAVCLFRSGLTRALAPEYTDGASVFTTRARRVAQEQSSAPWQATASPVRTTMNTAKIENDDWIKVDLHIHTLDDPKDVIDYSAHQLLERARALGFGVLAITLHDVVFDRPEVFADAAAMGILLIPAAEMRLQGADVIVLNIDNEEAAGLRTFEDLRKLRARRGRSVFAIAPHPFYIFGGSIGRQIIDVIDCFDAIEHCHFHKGLFNLNRRARQIARQFRKPLVATSDAHRLRAFGRHYASIPRPTDLTVENVFTALRTGPLRLTSPPCSLLDLVSTTYFVFLAHPFRQWRELRRNRTLRGQLALESKSQT